MIAWVSPPMMALRSPPMIASERVDRLVFVDRHR